MMFCLSLIHIFAVFQGHDLALLDGLAVELTVTGGIGHQAGGHLVGSRHHVDGIFVRGRFGVKVQHGGHALGHRAGGQDQNLAVGQLLGLFRCHDDRCV